MLHDVLNRMIRTPLLAVPDIAHAMNQDGAVALRFEGGLFGPGTITISVPNGLEEAAAQALLSLHHSACIPVFIGVAALGQPSGLSHTQARLRLENTHTGAGHVHSGFTLELGWQTPQEACAVAA